MAIQIGSNFIYRGQNPLDSRNCFDTISSMVSFAEKSIDDGHISYCKETDKYYTFNSSNTTDTTLGKWREFSSGNVSFKDYVENTSFKEGDYLVSDGIIYKVLKDYTSYNISDDINDGNLKQYIGNNGGGSNIIEISNILTNTKIGGDEMIDSSILSSNIDDLKLNQLVYDTNGIMASIYTIDKTNNKVVLRIIHANQDTSKITVIPEPNQDDKLYFRSREVGATDGKWVLFDNVNGAEIELTINKKDSSIDGEYIPKAQELVYDTFSNIIVIGDGTTKLLNLKAFYSTTITKEDIITTLGFNPENVLQKGQPNGYAALDANGLIPTANLPANVISSYSKDEIDKKDTDILNSATTLVNTEASTARMNEEAIQNNLDNHTDNSVIHVTQDDKDKWNGKVDSDDLLNYETHISDSSIHVTQADKDKWNGMNKCYFVNNESDLPMENNDIGNIGYVKTSADGVTPIACATFIWDGSSWRELDQTQVSLEFKWDNIQNKPNSTVMQIDNTIAIAHKHNNKDILDKIAQSINGNFMYNGVEIGIKVIFKDTERDLPSVGDEDTLYVIYSDSRVRNYPSISVYRDGAYQILGRGTQDVPQQVGDMEILQNEFFSVAENKSFIITVTSNQFFSFLPVEILKKKPGEKAQEKILFSTEEPDNFKYDKDILDITQNNHITINIKSISLKLDKVLDRYMLYEDVDLSKFKDISYIG